MWGKWVRGDARVENPYSRIEKELIERNPDSEFVEFEMREAYPSESEFRRAWEGVMVNLE